MHDEKPNLAGMTVNERLFAVGLLDEFDAAARRGDRTKMIECFTAIGLGADAASRTETVLNHPTRYGRLNSN